MKKWIVAALLLTGCGINTVTKAEIEGIGQGDILVWRYQKGGKSWMFLDKVTKVEGDKVVYVTSRKEGTSKRMKQLEEWTTQERETSKTELAKYEKEQGAEEKLIIEIRKP